MVRFNPMDGMLGEFVGVIEIHLDFDVSPVRLHRFGADVERLEIHDCQSRL